MDWWTLLKTGFTLLWIFCFIDGNAVLELRQFFHDLTKATCHLYLALLPLRRAATHFAKSIISLFRYVNQSLSAHSDYTDSKKHLQEDQSLARDGMLHLLEGTCVVCETVPNLIGAARTLGAAFCHILQAGFYILAATLRSIQICLFSGINGEKEKWDKEQLRAKDREKNQLQRAGVHHGVLSGACQCFLKKG